MALVELLGRNRFELEVEPILAYVDHSLRGKRASRHERRTVTLLAERHSLPMRIAELNPEEVHRGSEGMEAEARRLRYESLARIAFEEGARGVVLAHHLDDQIETVLMRMVCGTSVEGLAAMRPCLQRGDTVLYRPLLSFRRNELRAVARQAGIKSVRDRSNRDQRRLRSRIRRDLLPRLERIRPSSLEAVGRLAEDAAMAADALRAIALSGIDDSGRFDRRRFFEQPPAVRLMQLHEAVRLKSDTPDYRIPRRFFAPLLTEGDCGLTGRVATGYGVELVLDRDTVAVSPASGVRAHESRIVQLIDENGYPPETPLPSPFDVLWIRIAAPDYSAVGALRRPVDVPAGDRIFFSMEVVSPIVSRRPSPRDGHAFGQTRGGFKRRIEREPSRFLVLCDAVGPRALFEVGEDDAIACETAIGAERDVRPAGNTFNISIYRRET